MEKKGGDDQFAVANPAANNATNNAAKAETRKTGAVDITQLLTGKTELSPPIGKNAAANRGAHPRRKDRRKAAVQKSLGIRCNPVSSSVAHRFLFGYYGLTFGAENNGFRFVTAAGLVVKPNGAKHGQEDGRQDGHHSKGSLRRNAQHF